MSLNPYKLNYWRPSKPSVNYQPPPYSSKPPVFLVIGIGEPRVFKTKKNLISFMKSTGHPFEKKHLDDNQYMKVLNLRKELWNIPKFKGMTSMYEGLLKASRRPVVRYETWEVYDQMSCD